MNNLTTSKKTIPPDIFTDSMQLTIPTIPQNKKGKGKAAINQLTQLEQELQNGVSEHSISYLLVNHLLKVLLEIEKDKEIQIAVQQQLEILDAIKEFKILGKKNKLKAMFLKQAKQETAENIVIS